MAQDPPSDFRPPRIAVSAATLAEHFRRHEPPESLLRNFHHEPKVDPALLASATPSGVLIPFVERADGLTLLLTRRTQNISLPGQICFPGGRAEPGDADRVATALRETHEETGLAPDAVEVLGTLGGYLTQRGHHIVPVVGLVRPPLALAPCPDEVEEILEFPADHVFRADSYRLRRHAPGSDWALFHLEHGGASVTGVTVCLLMNLYQQLVASHAP